jgi:hypothetical protein
MKFKLFNSRGEFSPMLMCGKPMWTTTNGLHTNYERHYQMWCSSNTYAGKHQLDITPSIFVNLWHKGCLSTDDILGVTIHSCGIGIRFWTWYGSITFMRSLNTKTTEEINKVLASNGMNMVL